MSCALFKLATTALIRYMLLEVPDEYFRPSPH
jgi:hypothetical protein